MESLSTLKFGLEIAGAFIGVVVVAFWLYMTLLSKRKSH